ncbi:mfs quinate transporter [Fusarium subglutinans]|uniref:Mfs quinate transporter n=1 Tax=Gibberella subglutinans TaxID=42677 RepID=A0A8H5NVV9_GIBSU|nr:mfs quinate transporter [Fusarium subglutinans]KAF5580642.1 mfs quinate transporter [Fusarium subglutinans]
MFCKWRGKDIKIYGNGVIECQGLVNIICIHDKKLTTSDNGGGMNLNLKYIPIVEKEYSDQLTIHSIPNLDNKHYKRPILFYAEDTTNLDVSGIDLKDSPCWNNFISAARIKVWAGEETGTRFVNNVTFNFQVCLTNNGTNDLRSSDNRNFWVARMDYGIILDSCYFSISADREMSMIESIGFTGTSVGLLATGIFGIVKMAAIILYSAFLVEKLGRLPLLMIGGVGTDVATFYLFGYSKVRTLGMAFGICVQWVTQFIVVYSLPHMIIGITYGTFLFFGAYTVLAIIFIWLFIPETKGVQLEDMDLLFGPNVPILAFQARTNYLQVIGARGLE